MVHRKAALVRRRVAVRDSCSSGWACTAVGESRDVNGNESPLVERWDGRSWSTQASPPNGVLNAVSCPSATACIAVGSFDEGSGGSFPVAQHWNGKRWTVDPVSMTDSTIGGSLDTLSCGSRLSCIAVSQGSTPSIISRWNGSRWSTRVQYLGIYDVSCTSARNCVGVGLDVGVHPGLDGLAVIYRWNGARWSKELTVSRPSSFDAVSCPSATACVAVGTYTKRGRVAGLIAAQLNAG